MVCKSAVVTILCTIFSAFIDLFCLLWDKKGKDSKDLNTCYAIAVNELNKGIQLYYRVINEGKLP